MKLASNTSSYCTLCSWGLFWPTPALNLLCELLTCLHGSSYRQKRILDDNLFAIYDDWRWFEKPLTFYNEHPFRLFQESNHILTLERYFLCCRTRCLSKQRSRTFPFLKEANQGTRARCTRLPTLRSNGLWTYCLPSSECDFCSQNDARCSYTPIARPYLSAFENEKSVREKLRRRRRPIWSLYSLRVYFVT